MHEKLLATCAVLCRTPHPPKCLVHVDTAPRRCNFRSCMLGRACSCDRKPRSVQSITVVMTMQVVRRTWDWLAEQPEDAAELAVLLFEAAPKLKISAGGSGGASRPPKASRRSSYKEEGGSQRRLSAGVPCPIGSPQTCPIYITSPVYCHHLVIFRLCITACEADVRTPFTLVFPCSCHAERPVAQNCAVRIDA